MFEIARIVGVPIRMHWSFSLLIAGIGGLGWWMSLSSFQVFMFSLLIFGLFFCVLMHELGHVYMARLKDVKTHDIILSPVGGVARLTRLPESAWDEFKIAFAGPAVNLLIGLALAGILSATDSWIDPRQASLPQMVFSASLSDYTNLLFYLNGSLVALNLIPAFPLDGGRMLRGALASRFDRVLATLIASRIGQATSIVAILSVFWTGNFILAFVGVFMFIMAAQEYAEVRKMESLKKLLVKDFMRIHYTFARENDLISNIIPSSIEHPCRENHFLIFNRSGVQIAGIMVKEAWETALKYPEDQPVAGEWMSPCHLTTYPEVNLAELYTKISSTNTHLVPVLENDQVIGIIDREQLEEFAKNS